eukprot:gene11967-25745_t
MMGDDQKGLVKLSTAPSELSFDELQLLETQYGLGLREEQWGKKEAKTRLGWMFLRPTTEAGGNILRDANSIFEVYETDGPATKQFARRLAAGTINLPYELAVRSHAHRKMQDKHIRGTYGGAPFKLYQPLKVAMQDMYNALAKAGKAGAAGPLSSRGNSRHGQRARGGGNHEGNPNQSTKLPPLRSDPDRKRYRDANNFDEEFDGGDDDSNDSVFV